MKKGNPVGRVVTVGIILALILSLSLAGLWYAGQTKLLVTRQLSAVLLSCRQRDGDGLLSGFDSLQALWEERKPLLSLFVRHDEIEKMDASLVTLRAFAETRAFDSAAHILRQMEFLASHIYERELPNLDNLF